MEQIEATPQAFYRTSGSISSPQLGFLFGLRIADEGRLRTVETIHGLAYMPQRDGLRALSVMAVIYTHYAPEKYWALNVYWGGLGVRCFFVLSGFLITTILLKSTDRPASFKEHYLAFIRRRAFRLYPMLLVALVVSAALGIEPIRKTFFWNVLRR